MADVPDQPVGRRVEDVVQRDGQLDDAEARAQMAAGHRHGIDGLLPQLVGELPQLLGLQAAQVRGHLHLIEQGSLQGTLGGLWQTGRSTM